MKAGRGSGVGWLAGVLVVAGLFWGGCHDSGPRSRQDATEDGGSGGGCGSDCAPPATTINRAPAPNPIIDENKQPGDRSWRGGAAAPDGALEAYTSVESAFAGEPLSVKVSTQTQTAVTAEVFRMGYYGGAGGRKMWSGGPWQVRAQSPCDRDAVTARIECDWDDTFTIPTDGSWLSGLYVVKLSLPDGGMRYVPFVLRDKRAADLLYTPNFTTYQAYNTWGGTSLYFDALWTTPFGRAREASFNRPYKDSNGAGKTFFLDINFIQLMEREGYDVTYGTQLDFVRHSDFLVGIGTFVDAAQDEYWTEQERDQVEAVLAGGKTSLVYFGGNGGYWRIRLRSDAKGNALRTQVCYKNESELDPQPGSTVRFRDPPRERPESNMFGAMYEGWQLVMFPMVVTDDRHWLFEGTGLTRGTLLQGMLGYEYDKDFPSLAGAPTGVHVSMMSPVVSGDGIPSYSTAVDYTTPQGRLVFSAGSICWGLGLGTDPELRDPRVDRMTLNVLDRSLLHRRPAPARAPVSRPGPVVSPPEGQWARAVEAFAGQAGVSGFKDGPAAEALFHSPTGMAVTPAGEVVVADTGNNAIRLIQADAAHTVITLAGNGQLGYQNGPGAQAMFRYPTAVAVGPAGEIYVADSGNQVIRVLQRDGSGGWTVDLYAGKPSQGGSTNGPATTARFNQPMALAIDAAGNLYVADQANNRIRRIHAGDRLVETIAGKGGGGRLDGPGASATLNNPTALALGRDGFLYVFDAGNQLVRRVSLSEPYTVDTVAGRMEGYAFGFADGAGDVARFRGQLGMTMSGDGQVVIADTGNFRVRKLRPGVPSASAHIVTIAGSGQLGTRLGSGDASDIVAPAGLATEGTGGIYVSDSFNHAIRRIVP